MENKKLTELSNEELLKRKKTTKFVTGLLLGMLTLLVILNIVNIINGKQNWTALTVPLALIPIAIINFNSIKEINKELKSRGLE
ncbi:hypothetical protein GCM10011514_13770 [Emticicia aquatilis]|uniref:Redox-active disulfide protein 2 n=1 Tax=Emticicia aquatilis TaxID=1537369 RepID=A0A916YL96_9BACT|nr:redox-active disulfide protein 2 [Emticicia aquatilis]GGD50748.1 hypothetical protein GCM10011514_13770 [Emticicia aquatilis]